MRSATVPRTSLRRGIRRAVAPWCGGRASLLAAASSGCGAAAPRARPNRSERPSERMRSKPLGMRRSRRRLYLGRIGAPPGHRAISSTGRTPPWPTASSTCPPPRSTRPSLGVGQARPRRLLGRVVRAVQDRSLPILGEIAAEHADQLTIAKLNVDDNPELAHALQRDEHPHAAGVLRRRGAASGSSAPRARPNCSRSSTNSSFPPTDPRSARRGHPRPAAPPRRRRLPPGRRRGRRVLRRRPRPPCVRFQRTAACTTTACCDEATWLALVEASWRLGDRPLQLVAPNLRGDDVGTLQASSAASGSTAGGSTASSGRPPRGRSRTSSATAASTSTGSADRRRCAPSRSTAPRPGPGPGVAAFRELEQLGARRRLAAASLRVVVGQFGGLSSLARPSPSRLRCAAAPTW